MTKVPDYEQGRIDVIFEIFNAAEEADEIHDKMENLLAKSISIVKRFNDKYVKGDVKK